LLDVPTSEADVGHYFVQMVVVFGTANADFICSFEGTD